MKKNKYSIHYTNEFDRELGKILKNKRDLAKRVDITIERIKKDPFIASLKTHTVKVSSFGRVYSSRVNGDYRIIWTIEEEGVILLQRIGSHSNSSKVYR